MKQFLQKTQNRLRHFWVDFLPVSVDFLILIGVFLWGVWLGVSRIENFIFITVCFVLYKMGGAVWRVLKKWGIDKIVYKTTCLIRNLVIWFFILFFLDIFGYWFFKDYLGYNYFSIFNCLFKS